MNDLDKILHFISAAPSRRVMYPNVKYIQRELFPNYNSDQIISLLNEIKHKRPDILIYKTSSAGDLIKITGLTQSFLDQGGFTEIERKQNIALQKSLEKESFEHEKTKVDLELATKMLKEFPKTKWFARIGFIIAVILALKELIEWLVKSLSR